MYKKMSRPIGVKDPFNLLLSHCLPTNPGTHWQLNPLTRSSHVPPFWQGFGEHSSISKNRQEFRHHLSHDDFINWKHFPRNWLFVRGIHRSPVNSPHNGQWRGAFMLSLICALNKRLSKQSWGWWFETPSRSFWRHCNAMQNVHGHVTIDSIQCW